MSEAGDPAQAPPKRTGRSRILLFALPVALCLGGGAFYAVYSGLVALPFLEGGDAAAGGGGAEVGAAALEPERAAAGVPGFVALEPLVISLAPDAGARHLRIALAIEVDPVRAAEVEALRPRVLDVLNTFLRAVDAAVLEQPRSMLRLRAQMLRRVQLVAPAGTVRDVLIQEFVLN